MSRRCIGAIGGVIVIMLVACTQVPEIEAWRPWTRILDRDRGLEWVGTYSITVTGETDPLLGEDDLLEEKVADAAIFLLGRRGFELTEEQPDYDILLSYSTKRIESESPSYLGVSRGIGVIDFKIDDVSTTTSGLGVRVARAVSVTTTTVQTFGRWQYNHTLSIEIRNNVGERLWKGESTWDSPQLDLLARLIPALQVMLSDLPAEPGILPEVQEVKRTHAQNYYRVNTMGIWFACPALPYRIRFSEAHWGWEPYYIKDGIKDRQALDAYLDLIQTAEYALPLGGSWKGDPIDPDIWQKVRLGSKYILNPAGDTVNVLMDLKGKRQGYVADKCWLANEKEYREFEKDMREWREALREYFDFYAE